MDSISQSQMFRKVLDVTHCMSMHNQYHKAIFELYHSKILRRNRVNHKIVLHCLTLTQVNLAGMLCGHCRCPQVITRAACFFASHKGAELLITSKLHGNKTTQRWQRGELQRAYAHVFLCFIKSDLFSLHFTTCDTAMLHHNFRNKYGFFVQLGSTVPRRAPIVFFTRD